MRAWPVLMLLLTGCMGAQGPDDPIPAPMSPSPLEEGPWGLACDPCNVAVSTALEKAFEPALAVHPDEPGRVIIAESPIPGEPVGVTVRSYAVHQSLDGGVSWTTTWHSRDHVADASSPWFGCTVIGDAVAAWASDGTLLVGGMAGASLGTLGIFVMRSHDAGLTFGAPMWLDRGAPGGACGGRAPEAGRITQSVDKPDMAAGSDGSVVVSWNRMGVAQEGAKRMNGFHVAWSEDAGASWGDPVLVPEALGSLGADMDLRDRQRLAMAHFQGGGTTFMATADGGTTWSTGRIGDVNNNYPSYTTVHDNEGLLHVVGWPAAQGSDHVPTLATSRDGQDWTPFALAAASPQYPMFAIDADGDTVYASYWTGTADAIHREVRAWRDGVLSEPLRLGPPTSRPHDMTPTGYGHYQSLAAFNGGAYVAWGVGDPLRADLAAAVVRA